MPHSLLLVETIARLSLPDGGVATWPKPSGRSEVGERNAGIAMAALLEDARADFAVVTTGDRESTVRSDPRCPTARGPSARRFQASASGEGRAPLPAGLGE